MTSADIIFYTSQSLLLVLLLSMPVVTVAAIVGLLVGLFQGLTQIQDQTLSFAIKLIAVIITIVLSAQWLGAEIYNFTIKMFDSIALIR
jgi:type III secretion protein S